MVKKLIKRFIFKQFVHVVGRSVNRLTAYFKQKAIENEAIRIKNIQKNNTVLIHTRLIKKKFR